MEESIITRESGLRLLGAGCLGAAAYAPGLLGAWTFMRLDFYAPEVKKIFFPKKF